MTSQFSKLKKKKKGILKDPLFSHLETCKRIFVKKEVQKKRLPDEVLFLNQRSSHTKWGLTWWSAVKVKFNLPLTTDKVRQA